MSSDIFSSKFTCLSFPLILNIFCAVSMLLLYAKESQDFISEVCYMHFYSLKSNMVHIEYHVMLRPTL